MFVPALVIFCVALAALDVAGAVAVRPMDATTSTRQSTTISSDRATAFRRIWGMRSALPVLRPLHSSVAGDSAFKQRPLNRALLRSTRIRALAEDGREMTADDFASLPPYHNPMLVDTLDDLEFAPLLAIDQMEENSAVERVVDYHRAVYAASIAKRGDATALAAVQRAHWNVAMSGQLRLLPPFPNDMRHLPRASEDDRELMFWFWRYRNEGLVVPPHLNWAAAKKLDLIVGRSGLELMAMSDGAKRDELRYAADVPFLVLV